MGKDSSRRGRWKRETIFIARKLDEDGSGNYFETDQSKTDTVTLSLTGTGAGVIPENFMQGLIHRIMHRLNPTNAVTYTLRLWRKGGVTGDYEANMELLYESPAARADDEDYDVVGENIPMLLNVPAKIWYSIDWSGASGNCPGYISVSGEVIH